MEDGPELVNLDVVLLLRECSPKKDCMMIHN